jgi:hypothetical protein
MIMLDFKVNQCSIGKRNEILTAHQLHDGRYYYMCFTCMSELFGEIVVMLSQENKIKFAELLERKSNG